MAKKVTVIVTETARDDLASMVEYVSTDSPRAARRIIRTIHDRLKTLRSFPKLGRVIPEIGDPALREIVVDPYRILYRLRKGRIEILRALHGRQFFAGI